MTSRIRRVGARAFTLLVAAVVLAALQACKAPPPLPRLGTVPRFSLLDESGRPFTEQRMRGKVWAAAFFFTRCPTVCPRITALMREVQIIAKTRGVPLELVSFSVDPEYDRPDVLRRYAEDHGADPKSWTFVTGDFDAIRGAVEKGFKIAVEGRAKASAPDYGILHGSHLVLVDRDLVIRGYYATTGKDEMGQLLVDAQRLAKR